jgi:hypothetical protein
MDRIAWLVHGNDPQSRDQAVMVAKLQQIDWDEINAWAANEGIATRIVDGIRKEAASDRP